MKFLSAPRITCQTAKRPIAKNAPAHLCTNNLGHFLMPWTPQKGLDFILCCFEVSLLGSRHYLRENRWHPKGGEVLILINNDCSVHDEQLNITYKHNTGKYRFKLFYTTVFTCSCWQETVYFSQRKKGEVRRKSKLQGSLLKVLRLNILLYVFCPLQTLHSQNVSHSLFFFLKCLFWPSGWKHKQAHTKAHTSTEAKQQQREFPAK